MKNLTIGKMAKLNDVSQQTLRLYDKMDLLKPIYVDETTGYRYYDVKQSARMDIIQYMKSLGMHLKEIKEALDKKDISIIEEILIKQNEQIEQEIEELKCRKNAIERTLDNYNRYRLSPKDGTIIIEYIPKRTIYCYNININFYEYGLDTYEYILRELRKHIVLNDLPTIYFSNVGTILRQNRAENREFISSEIFIFVDDEFKTKDMVEIIPQNTFLCMYCDDFHKEIKYAKKLLNYIKENNLIINGDCICEVIADLPVLENGERNIFFKLQIPIKFN